MKSNVKFQRWSAVQRQTWPFQLYKQYNEELSGFIWAEYAAHEYTKKQIKKEVKDMATDCAPYITFPPKVWNFQTMQQWLDAFDEGQNFLYLNCVVALSSNLETFLSAIISLAIESNPGVLLKAPMSIDGVKLLKYKPLDKKVYEKQVKACVEGTWQKRKNAIKDLFGCYPIELDKNTNALESIRKMRNKVGHAFGRDIDQSRVFSSLMKQPSERVSLQTLRNWLAVTYEVAVAMDSFLLQNSIGEYQAILAYHNNKSAWSTKLSKEKARELKKMYGAMDQQIGLTFCQGLIEYYDSI